MSEQDTKSRNYFYHLRLELYRTSEAIPNNRNTAKSTSAKHQGTDYGVKSKRKGKEKVQTSEGANIWLPPASTDIFGPLPGQTQPDGLRNNLRHKPLPTKIGIKAQSLHASGVDTSKSSSATRQSSDRADKEIPGDKEDRRTYQAGQDWRFDSIRIDSLDMAPPAASISSVFTASTSETSRNTSSGHKALHETRAKFEPLSIECKGLRSTEVGWGIVHLYREGNKDQSLHSTTSNVGSSMTGTEDDTTVLCIPAVPSYLTPSDFLGWAGEKTIDQVSNVRFIVTGQLNRYLVLMKFRDGAVAKRWKRDWDGKVFAGMEPENCHVVFVRSIVFDNPLTANFSDISHDPFITSFASAPNDATATLDYRPLPPPTPSLLELPTCPVCLERMDSSTTGLLTILCAHSFHCTCLLKWRGSGCPVCRHVQPSSSLNLTRPFGSSEISHDFCSVCDTQEDLWICLICGNVGCGRYKGGHAKEHWKEEAHCFALEIETQYVWDYAGDMWVHRLISTKGDGKVVELPGARPHDDDDDGVEMVPRSKLEGMGMEYTQLLISQLESQRIYFEEQVKKAVDKATTASTSAEAAATESAQKKEEMLRLSFEMEVLQRERDALEKERDRLKIRADKSAEIARRMTMSFQEEKQVGKGLMERIGHINEAMAKQTSEIQTLQTEVEDLKEQNRDLSFFISSQEKLRNVESELGEEIKEGTMSLPEMKETPQSKKKGKGKK